MRGTRLKTSTEWPQASCQQVGMHQDQTNNSAVEIIKWAQEHF